MRSISLTPRRRRSRSAATPDELVVGRIAGCFGVRGELKCATSRSARALFVPGARFRYARAGREGIARLETVRAHGGRLLVTLEGVRDRTAAEVFVGAELYADRETIPLDEGEYLDASLVGCAVVDASGRACGSVERVEHLPASDMLVVGGRMIPMVAAIVRDVDVAQKRIVIDPPEGLLD